MSVFGVFLVFIFSHSDLIFRPNAGKYGPEKLRIPTLFAQCYTKVSGDKHRPEAIVFHLMVTFNYRNPGVRSIHFIDPEILKGCVNNGAMLPYCQQQKHQNLWLISKMIEPSVLGFYIFFNVLFGRL